MAQEADRFAALATLAKIVWPHFASFAGSILSLAFVEQLTKRGKALAVIMGVATATFIGPILHFAFAHYMPFVPADVAAPGLNFLLSLCSMACIPGVLRQLQKSAPNLVDALLKKVAPQ